MKSLALIIATASLHVQPGHGAGSAGLGNCDSPFATFYFDGSDETYSTISPLSDQSVCLDASSQNSDHAMLFETCDKSNMQMYKMSAPPSHGSSSGTLLSSAGEQSCKKPSRSGNCYMCLDVYAGKGPIDPFDCKESGDGELENQVWIVDASQTASGQVQFQWAQDRTKCLVLVKGPPTPPPRGVPLPFSPVGHLGRVYDGIGGLSNSDAMMLRDYPEPQRSDILDLLFKPGSLAQMSFLKIEIGGDGSSTVSTESSWQHHENDTAFNPERGWENWLIQEAKARNPDIKLYGLAWAAPGHLANQSIPEVDEDEPETDDGTPSGNNKVYYSFATADYLVGWVKGVKATLGYLVEHLGIRNESGNPPNWFIKLLRNKMDEAGLQDVGIVVADQHDFTIVDQLLQDQEAMDAVEVLGVHEPLRTTESVPANAIATGKKMWGSESYTTYSDNNGGGCWARENSWCYVYGQVTANLAWNLIQTYPWGLAYDGHGLMWAVEPWSGHYVINPPIYATAHYSQFTWPCWRYLDNGFGSGLLPGGGSYVGYVPGSECAMAGSGDEGSAMRPRPWDFTIVAQTMEHNNSACYKDSHPAYSVDPLQRVAFELSEDVVKALPAGTKLHLWRSYFAPGDDVYHPTESTFFEYAGTVDYEPKAGGGAIVNVTMRSNGMYTLSTLAGGKSIPSIPSNGPFPTKYTSDMSVEKDGQRTPFTLDVTGVFEGYTVEGDDAPRITQVVPRPPILWHGDARPHPVTLIGGVNRTSVTVQVSVRPAEESRGYPDRGFAGVQVLSKLSWPPVDGLAPRSFIVFKNGTWLYTPTTGERVKGTVSVPSSGWYDLEVQQDESGSVLGSINGKQVLKSSVGDRSPTDGWAALVSSFGYSQFKQLTVAGPTSSD